MNLLYINHVYILVTCIINTNLCDIHTMVWKSNNTSFLHWSILIIILKVVNSSTVRVILKKMEKRKWGDILSP